MMLKPTFYNLSIRIRKKIGCEHKYVVDINTCLLMFRGRICILFQTFVNKKENKKYIVRLPQKKCFWNSRRK